MGKADLTLVVDNTRLAQAVRQGAIREHIVKATVDRLARLPKGGIDVYVQDTELPGFRLRRSPACGVFFLASGRIRGGEGINKNRMVKQTLGPAVGKGAITVAKARLLAAALRDQLAQGINPEDERRAKADAAEAVRRGDERQRELEQWTVAYALKHMLEWRAARPDPAQHLRPETVEYYERAIGYLGKLANVPIVDLRADAIRSSLDRVGGKAKPAKARRALSGVINHAIKRLDLNIANPVSRLDRGEFKAPAPRTNYISEQDIGEFVGRVAALGIEERGHWREARRAKDYLMLTLLYGTRAKELMQLQWEWVNWTARTITLPASVTKQKRSHTLPLTPWTLGILKRRYDARKPEVSYVFPGDVDGQPMKDVRVSLTKAGSATLKLHDLRRTLVTHCASLGISGARLKALVGHARDGVTEAYDQREVEQVRRDFATYHEWVRARHAEWERGIADDAYDASPEGQERGVLQAADDAAYEAWLAQQPAEPVPPQWPGL